MKDGPIGINQSIKTVLSFESVEQAYRQGRDVPDERVGHRAHTLPGRVAE